jgi:hypothetical protein
MYDFCSQKNISSFILAIQISLDKLTTRSRRAIVVTYNKANFLIEMFRINNWYLEEHQKIVDVSEQGYDTGAEMTRLLETRINHAQALKAVNENLDFETKNLLEKIDKYCLRNSSLKDER